MSTGGRGRQQQKKFGPEGLEAIERNAARPKDMKRRIPKPVVVNLKVNGKQIRALIDSGSMADFISTTAVDQLKLKPEALAKPLPVQLAVHGSRSKINFSVEAQFEYQEINCRKRFDVANLDNYDMILGTPFIYQHKVLVGLNPTRVYIGSVEPLPMSGPEITSITSAAADIVDDELEKLREKLRKEAADLCPNTEQTGLPPLRAVNHTIPLIDETKVYGFRPSKCPEAMKPLWREKKNAYL
ncbi:hypothetical protein PENSPDRAFT_595244, partial [Peniophora sp. CONT]